MSPKKATVILEGNSRQTERVIHELNKLVSEANREPELAASLQTERVDAGSELEIEGAFENGHYE